MASWHCHLPVGDGVLEWKRAPFPHGVMCDSPTSLRMTYLTPLPRQLLLPAAPG